MRRSTEISAAADAEVWLGDKGTGLLLKNSSNTFDDIIEGVSIEFKQVHGANDSPLNVPVLAATSTATKEQLNSFIDAYNKLMGEIDSLTKRGSSGSSGGAFAGDSGIASLKNQLNNLIRTPMNGHMLTDFGITADREGKLTLDSKRIDEVLKTDPTALNEMFNGDSGLIKALDKSLDGFLNNTNGQIKLREENLTRREGQMQSRADAIDVRYQNSYNRYLTQFTQLQKIMTQMNSTMSMFSNIATQTN
jgi:flagellar hook-associated protein 2